MVVNASAKQIYDSNKIPDKELAVKIKQRGKYADDSKSSVRAEGNQGNKTSAAVGGSFAR